MITIMAEPFGHQRKEIQPLRKFLKILFHFRKSR